MADETAADESAASPDAPDVAEEVADGHPVEEVAAAETETSPVAETPAATEDEPEEFRNALAKHKGDKAQLGADYWRIQKDNARLAKELDDIKAKAEPKPAASPAAKVAEPEPVDLGPELQELETYLGSLEEESKALPAQQQERLNRIVKHHEDVIRAQTLLERADPIDKPEHEQALRLAKLHKSDEERAYARGKDRERDIAQEKRRVARERDGIKRQLDSDRERQEQADKDHAAFMQDFPAYVDGQMFKVFDTLNLSKDKDFRQALWEDVNKALIPAYRKLQGIPHDQVDHPALIKSEVEKQLKRYDVAGRAKFAQVSQQKAKTAQPSTAAKPAPAAAPKRAPLPYEIDDVDPKIKAARERARARGWA